MKVSIVIPVYNCENYIERCLDSVLSQTYEYLEVIVINDGSKDKSLSILKKYEKKHPKIIKCFSHENHGVAYTRNFGLKKATGDFITFIDSDDYIDEDYIETLVNNIEDNDVIYCGYKNVTNDGKILSKVTLQDTEWTKYKSISTWAKLYKLEFLKNNNITYPNYKIGEDLYFNMLVVGTTNKVKIINTCGYNYVQNDSSVTRSVKNKYDMLSELKVLHEDLETRKANFSISTMSMLYLKTMLFLIILQRKSLSATELNQQYKDVMIWLKEIGNKKIFFTPKGEELKIILFVNIFIIAYHLRLSKILFKILKCF